MAVGDAYVFPGFLTPVLTQLFFQKPPTTFLTCFCRGENTPSLSVTYLGLLESKCNIIKLRPVTYNARSCVTLGSSKSCRIGLKTSVNSLPHNPDFYHTIPTFNEPEEEGFGKLVTSIYSFSHSVFFSVIKRNCHFNNVLFVVCKC